MQFQGSFAKRKVLITALIFFIFTNIHEFDHKFHKTNIYIYFVSEISDIRAHISAN